MTIQVATTPSQRELQWFGVIVLTAFGIIGAVAFWRFDSVRAASALWGAGSVIATAYYSVPTLRVPIYRLWMTATRPIGQFVSTALLGVIYFLLITPIAVVLRVFRRDALALRMDRGSGSYWTPHDPGDDRDRYFRQS